MQKDKFQLLFEHSSDAHLIMVGNRITDCNPAAVRLLKAASREDILCKHPAYFSPAFQPDGSSSAEKSAQMDELTRQKGFHSFEWYHQKMDGEVFPVQVTLNALEIEGEPSMIAVWHDLTELKQKEYDLLSVNEKLKKELNAAAQIQRSLLPVSSPLLRGLRASWVFKPCEALGGDMLNIFHLDEKHLGLYVLDVTGHGVAASLLSVAVSQFLSPYAETSFVRSGRAGSSGVYARPAEVAQKLNRHFAANPEQVQMFTLLYGVLNVETHELCYVCAGHPLPIIVTAEGRVRTVEGAGIPIGVAQDYSYSEQCLKLQPGDRLYLYSDGIPEAKNRRRELFEKDRLMNLLSQTRSEPLSQSLETALSSVEAWCEPERPGDDITLLACEIHPGSAAG